MAILRYPYEKISRKVIILSILSNSPIPAPTIWTIKSKPLRVMRQMSTFWNHNKEHFHVLNNEHNQRTFLLHPPYHLEGPKPLFCENSYPSLCKNANYSYIMPLKSRRAPVESLLYVSFKN